MYTIEIGKREREGGGERARARDSDFFALSFLLCLSSLKKE